MRRRAEVTDEVLCPEPVAPEVIRDGFTRSLGRLTAGIVRGRPDGFYLGPVPLIRLGPPELAAGGVRWPVVGGLLTRRPGGHVGFGYAAGRLGGYVTGWEPALPLPLYRAVQLPVHHELTRLYLLHLRGRLPLPGPAPPAERRLAAAALDLALCAVVAGRRPRRLLGVAAAYHVAAWTLAGQTLGGALAGLRLVAVDGSRVTIGQAVARLLRIPWGPAAQDRAAGTAVVVEEP